MLGMLIKKSSTGFTEMFGEFCLEVFDYKKLAEKNGANLDYKAIHSAINAMIKVALDTERVELFANDAKEVIYAMAAIADEVFLSMDWVGKQYWEESMLEKYYFGSQMAGDKIFHGINRLVSEKGTVAVEKAEIYLKILALGFKGRYRGTEEEQVGITHYRNKLFEFIEKNDKSVFLVGPRLFQKEYTHVLPNIHRKLLPDGSIISYVIAFFAFMFLVISTVVWMFETRELRLLLMDIAKIALEK